MDITNGQTKSDAVLSPLGYPTQPPILPPMVGVGERHCGAEFLPALSPPPLRQIGPLCSSSSLSPTTSTSLSRAALDSHSDKLLSSQHQNYHHSKGSNLALPGIAGRHFCPSRLGSLPHYFGFGNQTKQIEDQTTEGLLQSVPNHQSATDDTRSTVASELANGTEQTHAPMSLPPTMLPNIPGTSLLIKPSLNHSDKLNSLDSSSNRILGAPDHLISSTSSNPTSLAFTTSTLNTNAGGICSGLSNPNCPDLINMYTGLVDKLGLTMGFSEHHRRNSEDFNSIADSSNERGTRNCENTSKPFLSSPFNNLSSDMGFINTMSTSSSSASTNLSASQQQGVAAVTPSATPANSAASFFSSYLGANAAAAAAAVALIAQSAAGAVSGGLQSGNTETGNQHQRSSHVLHHSEAPSTSSLPLVDEKASEFRELIGQMNDCSSEIKGNSGNATSNDHPPKPKAGLNHKCTTEEPSSFYVSSFNSGCKSSSVPEVETISCTDAGLTTLVPSLISNSSSSSSSATSPPHSFALSLTLPAPGLPLPSSNISLSSMDSSSVLRKQNLSLPLNSQTDSSHISGLFAFDTLVKSMVNNCDVEQQKAVLLAAFQETNANRLSTIFCSSGNSKVVNSVQTSTIASSQNYLENSHDCDEGNTPVHVSNGMLPASAAAMMMLMKRTGQFSTAKHSSLSDPISALSPEEYAAAPITSLSQIDENTMPIHYDVLNSTETAVDGHARS